MFIGTKWIDICFVCRALRPVRVRSLASHGSDAHDFQALMRSEGGESRA